MLTKEDIEEFKRIYFEDYGVELTDLEAVDYATRLINVMAVLIKVEKREQSEE